MSTLQDKGVPMPVERTLICPPRCRMGAITAEERAAVRTRSPVGAKYDTPVNRESAYEILSQRAGTRDEAARPRGAPAEQPRRAPPEQTAEGPAQRPASSTADPPSRSGPLGDLL